MDEAEDVATAIRNWLKQRDRQQKALATDWCAAHGNKKSDATFNSRLSNLLNDDDAGYAFVLDDPDAQAHLEALAKCLGWPPEQLRERCEAARKRPTLVFPADAPADQVTFFQKRAERFPVRVRCVQLEASVKSLEQLRDCAKKIRKALLVVSSDRDAVFYKGAEVRTTRVESKGAGFHVAEIADLFPLLAPRTEDSDGMKMFQAPTIEAKYREQRHPSSDADRWLARIREADAESTPVTFRLDWLLEEWGARKPKPEEIERVAIEQAKAKTPDAVYAGSLDSLWLHGDRLLSLRSPPRAHQGRPELEIHVVTTFQPIVAKLRRMSEGLNPHADGGNFDISSEVEAFAQETGITLSFAPATIRGIRHPRARNNTSGFLDGVSVRRGPELDARLRSIIEDLLQRDLVLPAESASVVWTLERLLAAPLLHVGRPAPDETLCALADLGTGNLLKLVVETYPAEQPAAVREWRAPGISTESEQVTLDAGDIRLTWCRRFDKNLEGETFHAVRRRRDLVAEEAARDD